MKKILLLFFFLGSQASFSQTARLKTPWTDQVSNDAPHSEYPRPQLVRSSWQNLNGQWDYAILPKGSLPEIGFAGKITVPFPVESYLSGVQKTVGPENELWYEKTVDLTLDRKGKRVLLHFGASDWETEVWVNGTSVGKHFGGFDSFSFDITDQLVEAKTVTVSGKNEFDFFRNFGEHRRQ